MDIVDRVHMELYMLGRASGVTVGVVAAVVNQVPKTMEKAYWTMLGNDLGMTVAVDVDQVPEMTKNAGNLLSGLWQHASE